MTEPTEQAQRPTPTSPTCESVREDVKWAPRDVGGDGELRSRPLAVPRPHKLRLGSLGALFVAAAAAFYAAHFGFLTATGRFEPLIERLTRATMLAALVLIGGVLLHAIVIERLEDAAARYNMGRVLRLAEGLVVAFILISVVFVNWYAAALSLGIVSAILGFALQAPIASFLGWIYILVKKPYRVGDRIQIGDATGDVIDVGYLDTTLWEFGGPYVSTDHPSGRLIKFPNANVLSQPVYNCSWPLFPYIWNEIAFQVAYGSDLKFVADTMHQVANAEVSDAMRRHVETYRRLLASTPVDQQLLQPSPIVSFRVSEDTWIEPTVRYLVAARSAGAVKSALVMKMLAALKAAPDKVVFPGGDTG